MRCGCLRCRIYSRHHVRSVSFDFNRFEKWAVPVSIDCAQDSKSDKRRAFWKHDWHREMPSENEGYKYDNPSMRLSLCNKRLEWMYLVVVILYSCNFGLQRQDADIAWNTFVTVVDDLLKILWKTSRCCCWLHLRKWQNLTSSLHADGVWNVTQKITYSRRYKFT